MRIKVYTPFGMKTRCVDERGWMEMEEGTTLKDAIKRTGIPLSAARILTVRLNGRIQSFDTPLKDGDVIGFFSLIAGG